MLQLVFGGIILLGILWKFRDSFIKRWYAWFISCGRKYEYKPYTEFRNNHIISSLSDVVSHDRELRKEKSLNILEIGVGSGANFISYPNGTRLTVVDPNPFFEKYYNGNRSKFPNIKSEKFVIAYGENMEMVESNSVDVVVTSHVQCIVKSNAELFQEIKRVLVPGGKYIFFEHIREFNGKKYFVRQNLQKFLNDSKIWPTIMDNCSCMRDCHDLIQNSGFTKVDVKRVHSPCNIITWFLAPHLLGVATK